MVPIFYLGLCFECDTAHRWSVSELCMLYKIICNPMHPVYGALPVPYVPERAKRGDLVAHQYILMRLLAEEPHSIVALLFPFSVHVVRSCCPCIRWCGPGGLQGQCQCLFIGLSCSIPVCLLLIFPFFLSVNRLVLWGWFLWTDRV